MKRILFVLVCLFLIGCTTGNIVYKEVKFDPVKTCVALCDNVVARGYDLSQGPCLSDGRAFVTDWVCDVVHDPRDEFVDNKPENQCEEYKKGRAKHFVEVNTHCKFLRKK